MSIADQVLIESLGSHVREARLRAGLTLRELARQANVSPSFVSQIENGKSQPSVSTLYAFSRLLGVAVDELFVDVPATEVAYVEGWGPDGSKNPTNAWHPTEYANRVSVVHPTHRPHLDMADGVIWERLAATPEKGVTFMKIVYAPGATSTAGGDLVSHDAYEYGYVLEGVLEVTVGEEVFVLRSGESLGFDSMLPHVLRNVGTTTFTGIWFVHSRKH